MATSNYFSINYYSLLAKIIGFITEGDPNFFPKRKKIHDVIAFVGSDEKIILGILSMFSILGFVEIYNEEDVIVVSKYAEIALFALKTRLDISIPIVANLRDSEIKRYFKTFTINLETIRKELNGNDFPIHTRELVNIIIKGKQIRNWKIREVFLHVYHHEWNEYHLVGLGRRGEVSIEELINKTMKLQLNLEPHEYEIDQNINPRPVEYKSISQSHGGITDYKIYTFVVRKLKVDLQDRMKTLENESAVNQPPLFNWFTIDEINQREVRDTKIKIMESTSRVLSNMDLLQIPNVFGRVKIRIYPQLISIKTDINNRVDGVKASIFLAAIVIVLLVFFNGTWLLSNMNVQLPWLNNLSNLAQIIGVLITCVLLIIGVKEST